jgi:hypothetical protein
VARFRRFISDGANRVMVGGIGHGLSLRSHRISRDLSSLFVVSLPRSFSSYTYLLARSALLMREPTITTFGEILNPDRFENGCASDEATRPSFFVRQDKDPASFHRHTAFLDGMVQRRGFAYKDVVQPFVVSAWLHARKEFRILHVRRNLADVASIMLDSKWLYPAGAADGQTPDIESAVVEGLVLADHVLAVLPAVTVNYDDLVRDGAALSAALSHLYPEYECPSIRFRNRQLVAEHARTAELRASPLYPVLNQKIQEVQANLRSEGYGNGRASSASR